MVGVLDVDVCRAIAAAIFGELKPSNSTPLSAKERLHCSTVRLKNLDILSRNTTWTMTRDASLGLNFLQLSHIIDGKFHGSQRTWTSIQHFKLQRLLPFAQTQVRD